MSLVQDRQNCVNVGNVRNDFRLILRFYGFALALFLHQYWWQKLSDYKLIDQTGEIHSNAHKNYQNIKKQLFLKFHICYIDVQLFQITSRLKAVLCPCVSFDLSLGHMLAGKALSENTTCWLQAPIGQMRFSGVTTKCSDAAAQISRIQKGTLVSCDVVRISISPTGGSDYSFGLCLSPFKSYFDLKKKKKKEVPIHTHFSVIMMCHCISCVCHWHMMPQRCCL